MDYHYNTFLHFYILAANGQTITLNPPTSGQEDTRRFYATRALAVFCAKNSLMLTQAQYESIQARLYAQP
jgi:hypothetical protein